MSRRRSGIDYFLIQTDAGQKHSQTHKMQRKKFVNIQSKRLSLKECLQNTDLDTKALNLEENKFENTLDSRISRKSKFCKSHSVPNTNKYESILFLFG